MVKNLKECNRLDVLDLTSDLRNSDLWGDLRNAIINKGVDLEKVALCQFCESEEGYEYGLLVFESYVIQFKREDSDTKNFENWNEFVDPVGMYSDCKQEVEWTREMLKNGDI